MPNRGRVDRGAAVGRPDRERLILVDSSDRPRGNGGEAPRAPVRPPAPRVLRFRVRPRRHAAHAAARRARHKYHSGGLWSNTCCGHPRPGEAVAPAAQRRLREEMGFDCPLRRAFGFVYHAELDDGLVEHEYDHVFIGRWDGVPVPNEDEVAEWRSRAIEPLRADVAERPHEYTY